MKRLKRLLTSPIAALMLLSAMFLSATGVLAEDDECWNNNYHCEWYWYGPIPYYWCHEAASNRACDGGGNIFIGW